MGLRALGINPVNAAIKALNDPAERRRKRLAQRRRALFEDNVADVLRAELAKVINDTKRRELIGAFAMMAGAINLFKRITREVALPICSPPPVRRVTSGEAAMRAVEKEARLDAKLRKAALVCFAGGASFYHDCYVPDLGVRRHVMWPDQVTVIPHPWDPTTEAAVIYDSKFMTTSGEWKPARIYWDNEEAFQLLDDNGNLKRAPLRVKDKDGKAQYSMQLLPDNGHPGILPITGIHWEERTDSYWAPNPNGDLDAAQTAISLALSMAVRLLKTQGHTKLAIGGTGGMESFPKGQTYDDENPFFAGAGNTATAVHNPTDPGHHLKVAEFLGMGVAANNGINRDRMNHQTGAAPADMAGMLERRREGIEVMREGDQRAFGPLKAASQQHEDADKRIPDDAELSEDFAEISHKVDRLTLLTIWEKEMDLGVRSIYDCVREDNPECVTDEQCQEELERNFESWAWLMEQKTSRGLSGSNTVREPGNSPEQNGANGPAVRDGEKSRDEAAEEAQLGRTGAAAKRGGQPPTGRPRRGA